MEGQKRWDYWLRCLNDGCVILPPLSSRLGVSSLLLGFYDGEDLVYAGRAGTGISESEMEILEREFEGAVKYQSSFKLPLRAFQKQVYK